MVNRSSAAEQHNVVIENVGLIADRLLAACGAVSNGEEINTKYLLEGALTMAAQAQQQLAEQSERIATLEELTFTDELTGLYNRRGFDEQLGRILAIAGRHGDSGVLAFIDLDDFKAVNDGLGHQAGDAVLRHVASLLSHNVRATDVVARPGGDEFIATLVHTGVRGGCRRAAALEQLLNAAVVRYGRFEIPVRASFGVTPYGPGDKAVDLLTRADTAMYRVKRTKPRMLRHWRVRTN